MTQRTPSDDAWLAVKDNIERVKRRTRITEGIPKPWRQFPLTIGLLIALISGVVFVAHVVRSYSADVREQIQAAIAQHDKDATCHMHMDADHNAQMAHIHTQLKELRQKIEALQDKHRRRR